MKNKRGTGSGSGGSANDPNTGGSTRSTPPSGAPGQPDFNDAMAGGSGGLDAARRQGIEPGMGSGGSMSGAGSTGGTASYGSTSGMEGGFGGQGSFAGQGGTGGTGGYGGSAYSAGGAGMAGERDAMQQAKDKVKDVASQVREENQGEMVARYIERASDQAQRFADYLRNAEPDQVVGEIQRFARRQPTLFLGGAFMLGLAASRFLKASERDQQRDMYGGPGGRDMTWNTATPRHGDELSSAWATAGDRELATPVVREPSPPTDQGLGTAGPIGMEGDFGSGMRDDLGPDRTDRPGGFAGPDTR